MSKMKSLMIDELNKTQIHEVTLGPDDLWLPRGYNHTTKPEPEKEIKPDQKSCLHDWHEVTLFTSTVTECKKCGLVQ